MTVCGDLPRARSVHVTADFKHTELDGRMDVKIFSLIAEEVISFLSQASFAEVFHKKPFSWIIVVGEQVVTATG